MQSQVSKCHFKASLCPCDICMALETPYGQARCRRSPGLSKSAQETYSHTTESPQSIFLVHFTQVLFFIMCSIQFIYLICHRNGFLDKKIPPHSAKSLTMKICLFSKDNIVPQSRPPYPNKSIPNQVFLDNT